MDDGPRFAALDVAFDAAVEKAVGPQDRVTVLFSGGVDSSLVADAARAFAEVDLFTVGLPGSADLEVAVRAAGELSLPHVGRTLQDAEVAELLESPGLLDEAEPHRSVLVSLAAAFRVAGSTSLLLGQGADELFGGYAHFRDLAGEPLERRRLVDWKRLRDVDWPATEALAHGFGRRLAAPFLDLRVAEVALSMPLEPVGARGLTKPVLRRWASHRGLPRSIVERPKRAMQYGTGIASAVRRRARATRPPR